MLFCIGVKELLILWEEDGSEASENRVLRILEKEGGR
jgi:hypothetical protein